MRIAIIIALWSGFSSWTIGQAELSMLGSPAIMQTDLYNPARFHQDGWHLGFPSFLYNLFHTGPGYRELIDRNSSNVPILKISSLRSGLQPDNLLASDFRVQTFKIKYGKDRWSFGLDHEIVTHNSINYPHELILLYLDGNKQFIGRSIEIAPDGYAYAFNSYGVTMSYKLPRLTIGVKPRILFGNHFGSTPRASAILHTSNDIYQVTLTTDYQLDNVGLLSFEDANFLNYRIESFERWQLFSNNIGMAVDLGMDIRVNHNLRVALSIVDLGTIRWSEGVRTYISNQTTVYEGIDVLDVFNVQQIGIGGTLDSLKSIFELQESTDATTFNLPFKWFAVANYEISSKFDLALISQYQRNQQQPLTLALQFSTPISKTFNLGTTISDRYGKFNLGLMGLIRRPGWIGYFAMDQFLAGLNPLISNNFNFRLGFNVHLSGTTSFN